VASGDAFGYSLSINKKGNTLAVGTWLGNYVQVYNLKNNKWYQLGNTLLGENWF